MSRRTSNAVKEIRSRGVDNPWLDYVLLGAPCFSTPMLLWAENYVGVGHPGRLVLIGGAAWAIAIVILVALRYSSLPRVVLLAGVWCLAYVFMRGGALVQTVGYVLAVAATLAIIFALSFLLSRQTERFQQTLVIVASALLAAEVMIAWYSSATSLGEDHARPPPREIEVNLRSKPDMVLVVADAYIGLEGLEQYFGVADPNWRDRLLEEGFTVPDVAYSPYASTATALAAILDMDYPIEAGPGITRATTRTLYERIGGDNRATRILASNKYQTTMIESGWSGSICGEEIEKCVPSPFLDESSFFALSKTWLGPWILSSFGYPFTVGALNSMSWLRENIGPITHDSKPDFVIAHIEIPHPPFFLDSLCNLDTSPARSGVTLQWPGTELEHRKDLYLEQAACFDGFVHDLAGLISEESILLIAGDHGSDSHHQLAMHPDDWSLDATRERLNVMFAYRGLGECEVGEPVLLSNVLKDVLECLGARDFPPVEPRMLRYAGVSFDGEPSPIVELSPEEVGGLLGR